MGKWYKKELECLTEMMWLSASFTNERNATLNNSEVFHTLKLAKLKKCQMIPSVGDNIEK